MDRLIKDQIGGLRCPQPRAVAVLAFAGGLSSFAWRNLRSNRVFRTSNGSCVSPAGTGTRWSG